MFLDQILRVSEVQEFEKGLAEHQLAKLSVDRRMEVKDEEGQKGRKGPETVLDRAVMEHNVLACAKVSAETKKLLLQRGLLFRTFRAHYLRLTTGV